MLHTANDLPIRLIALDMDGTLLNEEGEIPQENIHALFAARDKGIHLAICSGRLPGDAGCFASDAGLDDSFILGLNGSYCLDKPNGSPIFIRYMEDKAVEACLHILEAESVTYSTFGRNHIAISRPFRTGRELENWGSHIERKGLLEYSYGMDGINRQRALGTNKIVYIEREDPERLKHIRQQIMLIPHLEVTSSWDNNIEIMPSDINKGIAVKELAGRLNLSAEQVMTLGDHDNDVTMLAYAGYGVAMGNASPDAMAAAKYVTGDNNACGVAQAVWKYALGERD